MLQLAGYTILEQIHESERAVLYRARRTQDQRPVIIKAVRGAAASSRRLEHLRNEYEIAGSLPASAVISPLALEALPDGLALVLLDCGGIALDKLCGQLGGRPMELSRFLRLAIKMAAVVREVHHEGVIHKDIKPQNLIVIGAGEAGDERQEVRLTDFGLATRLLRDHAAYGPAAAALEGTPAYLSPEQTGRMNRALDWRTDLYSLGVTFYQMLTGTLPFQEVDPPRDPIEWIHAHVARAPVPPAKHLPGLPAVVSDIVMHLLAKVVEERYQSAGGVLHDLLRCQVALAAGVPDDHRGASWVAIEPFPLGERDRSGRFQVTQKVYGRAAELQTLLSAWERVAGSGATELVLVAGYSGIGKSTVVNELHRPLLQRRGLFLSGKFDQLQRDIPYATLLAAFSGLLRQLLADGEPALSGWRARLGPALGQEGRLITDLLPLLELIIGPAPPLAGCPPAEAQARFDRVFRRFLGVFATAEHPMVLFLDDLQWTDAASLRLIQSLSTHLQTRYLLLIGTYRDNEVGPAHPLALTLDEIRKSVTPVCLTLGPLTPEAVAELVAATLSCPVAESQALADLVFRKTQGNPFFVSQFLQSLHRGGLLNFDETAEAGPRWAWDLARIEEADVTDNVIEMMARAIRGVDERTQQVLRVAACLGHRFDLAALAAVMGRTVEQVARDLWPARHQELIVPDAGPEGGAGEGATGYRWLHDRIQQAALSLIRPAELPALRLHIGRTLLGLRGGDAGGAQLHIFDIVEHLNAGAALIADPEEARALCLLDLAAGRRARGSVAFTAACTFLRAGIGVLDQIGRITREGLQAPRPINHRGGDCWATDHCTALALHQELAECAYLDGKPAEAEALVQEILAHAIEDLHRAEALGLKAKIDVSGGRYADSASAGLTALRLLGHEIEAEPERWPAAIGAALGRLQALLSGIDIAGLIDRPMTTDPRHRLATRILASAVIPASYSVDGSLFVLAAEKLAEILLTCGHTEEASFGYAACGMLLVTVLKDHDTGSQFGDLALALMERPGMDTGKGAAISLINPFLSSWKHPLSTALALAREGLRSALETGDLSSASFNWYSVSEFMLESGEPLPQTEPELDRALQFSSQLGHRYTHWPISILRQAIRALRGRTGRLTDLSDSSFDEQAIVASEVAGKTNIAAGLYYRIKVMLAVVAGDVALGQQAARCYDAIRQACAGIYADAEHDLHRALLFGAAYDAAGEAERVTLLAGIEQACLQLGSAAGLCPENFADKHALAAAELARLRGLDLEASRLYEEGLSAARRQGFIQIEALGAEAAARFYSSRDRGALARGYLEEARTAYLRWGAEAKVTLLDRKLGRSAVGWPAGPGSPSHSTTLEVQPAQLDAMAVVRASQMISTELHLPRLVQSLMQLVVKNAGAQAGALIMLRQDQLWVEAVSPPDSSGGAGGPPFWAGQGDTLPLSILSYVQRTREKVLQDQGAAQGLFAADPYLVRRGPRSLLCLPMLRQGQLSGMLYLENSLLDHAFSADRIAVLEVLASQAAISIENARLYEQLEQRVEERTQELRQAQKELLATARRAGMAEIANGVLHNVGNALNSVNIATGLAVERVRGSKLEALVRTMVLLEEHAHDLGTYLTQDPKGQKLAAYLMKLTEALQAERRELLLALSRVTQGVDHIKGIVRTQQAHAGSCAIIEEVDLVEVVEDALRMSGASLLRHDVAVRRQFVVSPRIQMDKHLMLQILINLITNAKQAMNEVPAKERVMTLRIDQGGAAAVRITVADQGVGISPENLTRLFSHGFTTRTDGHGFGLHSSALAARQMNATLTVHSEGAGKGAAFTIELPLRPQ